MSLTKVVNTDNFDGDYPDEKFLNIPNMPKEYSKRVADVLNEYAGPHSSRYWKVVPVDYILKGGFEP